MDSPDNSIGFLQRVRAAEGLYGHRQSAHALGDSGDLGRGSLANRQRNLALHKGEALELWWLNSF